MKIAYIVKVEIAAKQNNNKRWKNAKKKIVAWEVLDLTRVLVGSYCGMLLADMGADVIKIEVIRQRGTTPAPTRL